MASGENVDVDVDVTLGESGELVQETKPPSSCEEEEVCLLPINQSMCPSTTKATETRLILPACHTIALGEICKSHNGECGTDVNLNNCGGGQSIYVRAFLEHCKDTMEEESMLPSTSPVLATSGSDEVEEAWISDPTTGDDSESSVSDQDGGTNGSVSVNDTDNTGTSSQNGDNENDNTNNDPQGWEDWNSQSTATTPTTTSGTYGAYSGNAWSGNGGSEDNLGGWWREARSGCNALLHDANAKALWCVMMGGVATLFFMIL